jgi:hypothetical protein
MDDEKLDLKLDELLADARHTYRVPPEPAVDAIWNAVAAEAFAPRTSRMATWRAAGMLAAASLVIGVVAGRWSAGGRAAAAAPATQAPVVATVAGPYQQATEDVLGRAAVLVTALRTSDVHGAPELASQATRLLGSTRLLIDSPAANDPRMRGLLLDLELTLAQIARLQPSRGEAELTLINNAVAERDIVPRIRSAVVDLSVGGY